MPNDDPKKLEELEKKVDILLEKMEKLEKLDKKALQMAKNKLNAQRGQRTPIDRCHFEILVLLLVRDILVI